MPSTEGSMPFIPRRVVSDGVGLATRDYGGSGLPLVLMHGAGMSQGSLEPLVAELLPSYRVMTFDLRGYGESDVGPWTLGSAVADLEAVVAAYELHDPAVGGHSLGGMVAAGYARQHPTCPGAVNLDGHGMGRVEQYVGIEPDRVRALWARQQRLLARAALLIGLLTPFAKVLGKRLPSMRTAREVQAVADSTDWLALYREVTCPLMVVNAVAPEDRPGAVKMLGEDGLQLMRAYREGLRRDLTALAAERPNVRYVEVDATHLLITRRPAEVADQVRGFLALGSCA